MNAAPVSAGLAGLVAAVLLIGGCARYELEVPQPNPTGQTWTATYVTWLWGAIETRQVASECDITNAIDLVRVKDNFGYDLLSVVTLGIVKPMTIEYKCGAPRAQVGEQL